MTYFFDLENVTRDDFRSLDLEEPTVTENDSLQSEGFLQFIDN